MADRERSKCCNRNTLGTKQFFDGIKNKIKQRLQLFGHDLIFV